MAMFYLADQPLLQGLIKQLYERLSGIVSLVVAIVGICYSYVLIKKARLESLKLEMDIIEKRRTLGLTPAVKVSRLRPLAFSFLENLSTLWQTSIEIKVLSISWIVGSVILLFAIPMDSRTIQVCLWVISLAPVGGLAGGILVGDDLNVSFRILVLLIAILLHFLVFCVSAYFGASLISAVAFMMGLAVTFGSLAGIIIRIIIKVIILICG